jgi:hypothetical protein
MKKVMEHVLDKIEEEAMGGSAEAPTNSNSSANPPEEKVKLYCLDHELAPDLDLRTVKHLHWKGPGDLVITYSLIKS